jgi:hypothetical protein
MAEDATLSSRGSLSPAAMSTGMEGKRDSFVGLQDSIVDRVDS